MEKTGWKVLAIIFIILFLLETSAVFWIMKEGLNENNNEIKCSNSICYDMQATSYIYDSPESTCYCYKGGEVIHQEYLE